jgi:DNA (cytosine-5)-methyltransferase 1
MSLDEAFSDSLDIDLIPNFSQSYFFKGKSVCKSVSFNGSSIERKFNLNAKSSGDPMAAWWRAYLDNEDQFGMPLSTSEGNSKEIRYIDLFSSVGGLSLGFEEAVRSLGYRPMPMLAVDIDERALAVHKVNHETKKVINDSVAALVDFKVLGQGKEAKFAFKPNVDSSYLRDLVGGVDAVLAGPPCQGHSTLNNYSRSNDPRNLLYLTVPAIAVALDIPIVIIENVPNVLNDVDNVVESTKALLVANGYSLTCSVLQAHLLGWPQTRKRFFLIATKGHIPVDLDLISKYLEHPALGTGWALKDVKVPDKLELDNIMNSVSEMSELNQKRIDWLFDNDSHELPNHIRPVCHQDGHTYPSVYGRMYWDKPAPTLTTGYVSPGRGRFIHPMERRVLTPREAARLQGFPDWFIFTPITGVHSKRGQLAKWVGDAVPSILGYVAGLAGLIDFESNKLSSLN